MLAKVVHTIRYLKARQIVARVWLNLKRRLYPVPALPKAVSFPGCRWGEHAQASGADWQLQCGASLAQGNVSFLHVERSLGCPPDWDLSSGSALWDYHLFYFDYLWAMEYEQARDMVFDWAASSGWQRKIAWDAYPVSLRLTNLCTYFFIKHRENLEADSGAEEKCWNMVFTHAEWLANHLEWHLMGNHLLENAASLALAGCGFGGTYARKWHEMGLRLLEKELKEQILDDGVHFERSPMYHLRVMHMLNVLQKTADVDLVRLVRPVFEKMQTALQLLCHPDGDIALFNDSALDQYGSPKRFLDTSISREPQGCFALSEAGYYGWRGPEGHYLVCDAGPIGPDYIPGHAHGDMLSFELSLNKHRVIVDSGVFEYEQGELRDYCRSTAAHNTVEIDGENQSEFWGAFRVARRARPREVCWNPSASGFQLSAGHDGYERLPGKPRHTRTFLWKNEGVLEIQDVVEAMTDVDAVLRIHLHPACRIIKQEDKTVLFSYPGGKCLVVSDGDGPFSVQPSVYCPCFGVRQENVVLAVEMHGRNLHHTLRVSVVGPSEED